MVFCTVEKGGWGNDDCCKLYKIKRKVETMYNFVNKQTYFKLIWSICYWPTWKAVLFKNKNNNSRFNINAFNHGDPIYIWQSKDIRVQCMVRIWKYNHQMTVWLACHIKQWWSTITLWLLIKTLNFYWSSLQKVKCNNFNKLLFLNLNHYLLLQENPLFFTLCILLT